MYIANRPLGARYQSLKTYEPLLAGELPAIVTNNTNHWRKAFNVYAKVLWQLQWAASSHCAAGSWQVYRDAHLLQAHSREALLFSPPDFSAGNASDSHNPQISANSSLPVVHWVVGKTYAAELALPPLVWLDAHFAVNREHRVIVSPYVDYRQLTNERIEQFAGIYHQLTR